jgi:hypothetical protein
MPRFASNPAPAVPRRARRIDHLRATLAHCGLVAPGGSPGGVAVPVLLDRMEAAQASAPGDPLTALVHALADAEVIVDTTQLAAAFATAIVDQARRDVATEAHRAGHANAFERLGEWIDSTPGPAALADLGAELETSPRGLQTALARLQHRFRQRVDAGLALWSDTAAERRALRQRLHSALIAPERLP